MRGKFRNSQQTPEPFTPGKVYALDFSLVEVNHTFLKGHRIMVQVQSTWFPLTDLNPQTFVDIPNAKPGDFKPAVERIYHTDPAAQRSPIPSIAVANSTCLACISDGTSVLVQLALSR